MSGAELLSHYHRPVTFSSLARTIEVASLADPALDVSRIVDAAFLVPNQTELSLLTGMAAGSRDDAEAAARALLARGIRTVIVTLGADGALLVRADEPAFHVPPVPVVPVDTTGAGDAFIGAFAQDFVADSDVPRGMRWATAYAADSITGTGTQSSFADRARFERSRKIVIRTESA